MWNEYGYGWRSIVVDTGETPTIIVNGDHAIYTLPSGLSLVVAADELFYRSEGDMARVQMESSIEALTDTLAGMDYSKLCLFADAISIQDKGIHSDRLLLTLHCQKRQIENEQNPSPFLSQLYGLFDRGEFAWQILAYQLGIDQDSLIQITRGVSSQYAPFMTDIQFRDRLIREEKLLQYDEKTGRLLGLESGTTHILASGQVLVVG